MQYLRIKEGIFLGEPSCMHHVNTTINKHIKYICAKGMYYVYYITMLYIIILLFISYTIIISYTDGITLTINIYSWYIITAQYNTGYNGCMTVWVVS